MQIGPVKCADANVGNNRSISTNFSLVQDKLIDYFFRSYDAFNSSVLTSYRFVRCFNRQLKSKIIFLLA